MTGVALTALGVVICAGEDVRAHSPLPRRIGRRFRCTEIPFGPRGGRRICGAFVPSQGAWFVQPGTPLLRHASRCPSLFTPLFSGLGKGSRYALLGLTFGVVQFVCFCRKCRVLAPTQIQSRFQSRFQPRFQSRFQSRRVVAILQISVPPRALQFSVPRLPEFSPASSKSHFRSSPPSQNPAPRPYRSAPPPPRQHPSIRRDDAGIHVRLLFGMVMAVQTAGAGRLRVELATFHVVTRIIEAKKI